MILLLILLVSILQIIAYYFADKKKLKYGRSIILGVVLIGHLFIFPTFFYPEPNPNGGNCGMPIMAITLAFGLFGGLGSLFIHFGYIFISSKSNV